MWPVSEECSRLDVCSWYGLVYDTSYNHTKQHGPTVDLNGRCVIS